MPFRQLSSTWLGFVLVLALTWMMGCGVTLAPPGWVREQNHGVCRAWFDFNSYRRPSLTIERYDRLPPDSARVKAFRWLHGGSVENYAVLSPVETGDFSPVQELDGGHTYEPEDSGGEGPVIDPPPPAPPSDRDPIFPNEFVPPGAMDEAIIADRTEIAAAPVSSSKFTGDKFAGEETNPLGEVILDFSPIEESDEAANPESISKPDCSLPVYYPVLVP